MVATWSRPGMIGALYTDERRPTDQALRPYSGNRLGAYREIGETRLNLLF